MSSERGVSVDEARGEQGEGTEGNGEEEDDRKRERGWGSRGDRLEEE